MKFLLLAALGSIVAPLSAAAQQHTPVPLVAAGNAVLTVTAEGRSLRSPDLALFNAGVATQGKTAEEALSANSSAMERVIAQLKRSGIAERDIQTSNLTVEPLYSDPNRDAALAARYSGQPYQPPPDAGVPKIIGYRANNSVSVRQRDLKRFGAIIDALVSAGANQVNGPSFTMDDPEPALDEARVEAMRKARQRGELYARAAGLKVVRIISINEGGGYYGPPPVAFVRGTGGGAPPPPPPPPAPIQPGELQMNATVTVQFELSP